MDELKKENEKLKAKIKELESRLAILKAQLEGNQLTAREAIKKYHDVNAELKGRRHKIDPSKTKFIEQGKFGTRTVLLLDDVEVVFESSNDKAALLAKAICKPSRLKKLEKSSATVEELYRWLNPGDDWFNTNESKREDFKAHLYQWFRRINDKASLGLNGKKVFEMVNEQYRFNPKINKNTPIGI